MSNPILDFLNPFFTRNRKGDYFYDMISSKNWSNGNFTNLEVAKCHPILTPALIFVSKIFSQARFYIEDLRDGSIIRDHEVLKLLYNPNYYQTQLDFLESLLFMKIASGSAVVYVKKSIGFNDPESLIVLDPEKIKYPDGFTTGARIGVARASILNTEVTYDPGGEDLKIKIKDLLYFYDSPNALNTKNAFISESRLTGLKQTLINTKDSLLAKNIILKTNGKEMITGPKSDTGFPMGENEKDDVESKLFGSYGLGSGRKRGIVTKANLNWQSLHIALRDLGLDESVKVDGNMIYTALHIPKDILSLEAKKTTYNNFKESMVSYIQNDHQPTVDSTCATLQPLVKEPYLRLRGTFDHMPIMKFVLLEKYDGVKKRGEALMALRSAGVPDELALDLCGLDKNIKLEPLTKTESNGKSKEESEQV